ncbi:NfeD family protein [Cumulibacter manganitolerans]|uniref:NfeD family protein n=1 Tax=Cumulibacter manganitolerans TaxID=1884992 RepID=UPI0012948AD1|nr:NfeD family protein [Cumulibacter manganitolerans]
MSPWAIWLVIAASSAGLEVLSGDFFLLMVGGGAAAAAIAAAAGAALWLQLVLFGVVSLLLVLGVRPWAKRMLLRGQPEIADGVDAVIGHGGVVTQTVDTHGGRIKVGADEWSAIAQLPYDVYEVGANVMIVEIRGAHAVVTADARDI